MEYVKRLSEALYNSIYNNHHLMHLNTIIFTQNLIIKDEYDNSHFINAPVTYENLGIFVVSYLKNEYDNESRARFLELILEDEDEENNTVILNIVCDKVN